ncbi:cytochrome c oxidase assembly protein [Heterostelium album PN500]|uniref:Cytochrome c oxidase assembly protein n=1 Tax=Heterostelium pallidum (strain ATCC 26659 / Pp 5 / PN500) TaxID=670386 RepID=D3BJT5_HETP5|nr:cytochrome c oxidase assembly protein [Heterostelium album PN500]EFA78165.1 cytochrome c oxidase assembly protein [Heterostelium album PN500]|eukprot:XP_020430291.1 cytochrome c oxidase assembly protein [Heterostelium album PN500]
MLSLYKSNININVLQKVRSTCSSSSSNNAISRASFTTLSTSTVTSSSSLASSIKFKDQSKNRLQSFSNINNNNNTFLNINNNSKNSSNINRLFNNNIISNRYNNNKRYYSSNQQENVNQQEKNNQEKVNEESNNNEQTDKEEIGRKRVGRWLLFSAALTGAMVVVGGITRLTESGLSMVEWKPIVGAIPPLSQEEWEEEFNRYKQYPEYQKLNKGMTVEEFKKIFFWEYSHRLMGRLIGVVFFFPFVVLKVRWDGTWSSRDSTRS